MTILVGVCANPVLEGKNWFRHDDVWITRVSTELSMFRIIDWQVAKSLTGTRRSQESIPTHTRMAVAGIGLSFCVSPSLMLNEWTRAY